MNAKKIAQYLARALGLIILVGTIVYPWVWLPSIIRAVQSRGLFDPKVVGALGAFLVVVIGGLMLGYVVAKSVLMKSKNEE